MAKSSIGCWFAFRYRKVPAFYCDLITLQSDCKNIPILLLTAIKVPRFRSRFVVSQCSVSKPQARRRRAIMSHIAVILPNGTSNVILDKTYFGRGSPPCITDANLNPRLFSVEPGGMRQQFLSCLSDHIKKSDSSPKSLTNASYYATWKVLCIAVLHVYAILKQHQ